MHQNRGTSVSSFIDMTRWGWPFRTQSEQFSYGKDHSRLMLHAPKHACPGSFRAKWQCLMRRSLSWPQL